MREWKIRGRLSGQSLPEVLVSMLMLGILMMISYTAMQQGVGLTSPRQQYVHAEMLREMLDTEWKTGESERSFQGRLLTRKVIRLDEKEPVFEVILRCYVGEKCVQESRRILRRETTEKP